MGVAILGIVIVIIGLNYRNPKDEILDSLQCCLEDNERIKLYCDGEVFYIFLPSGIDMKDVTFFCESDVFAINNSVIHSGESFLDLDVIAGKSYELAYKKVYYDLRILQSENVASFFISNASGTLEEILDDKNHKEPVKLKVFNENGNYENVLMGEIKGRGNSTWLLDKKPFNLYLDETSSLLGLPESDKFCLLANAYDESNIRNKLVYDFANKVETNWTPSCEYVDLYINGEYYGLYLLTERVQIGESKIDISQDTGYLYSMSIPSRTSTLDDYVVTEDNRIVEVKYSNDNDKLLEHLNEFELELDKGNGTRYIDLDSWSRKYLIEEIFLNTDIASFYFYWDSGGDDSLIYAGPQWDYDNALGNAALNRVKVSPTAQLLKQQKRFTNYGNAWFCELADDPEFSKIVKDKYKNEYRGLVENIITYDIDVLENRIEKASYNNSIRWKNMFDAFVKNDTANEIKEYMIERVAFLDSLFINEDEWITVRLDRGSGKSYLYYSVKVGEPFVNLPDAFEADLPGLVKWVDGSTEEDYSPYEKLYADKYLRAVTEKSVIAEKNGVRKYLTKANAFYFGVCFLFIITILVMILIDRRRQNGA